MIKYNTTIKKEDKDNFELLLRELNYMVNLNEESNLNDIGKKLIEVTDICKKFINKDVQEMIYKLTKLLLNEGLSDNFQYQLSLLNDISTRDIEKETIDFIGDKYQELYKDKKLDGGISTLCVELDKRIGGMRKGKIASFVGASGCMKTTTVLNIAYNEVKKGSNVVFLSLEEPVYDIYSKILSRHSRTTGNNFTTQSILQKKLNTNEEEILFNTIEKSFKELKGNLYILGEEHLGSMSQMEITNRLKEIEEKIKQDTNDETQGIDIVIVDHLQIFRFCSIDTKNEFEIMNSYVSYFRKQAKNFLDTNKEVLIILLSQVNREGMAYAQKHDGLYKMQHIAEASELERASSYIISLYTDGMVQASKLLKMGAIKLRGAALPLDAVNVFADGQYYQVGEVEVQDFTNYSYEDVNVEPQVEVDEETLIQTLEDLLGGLNI